MPEAPVFSVSRLAFRYDRKPAVTCEALEVLTGETVAFTGPNGSGKTTMLKLLNGLLGPYDGAIEFMGLPLRRNPWLRLRSIYVHQHPILFAGTVRDNLEYALKLKNIPRGEAGERIERVATRFGIETLLMREAARLSARR